MAASELIESARRGLGDVGAFLGVGVGNHAPAVPVQQDGIRRLESAGWPSVWTNEVIGADALVRAALWLAATERIVVGTCIANMWVRPAPTAHAAAAQLTQAYPGRFVLGLGVGYPGQADAVGRTFGSPSATARAYLEATTPAAYVRLLAANGPKLTGVAAELADGALPAGSPPAATAAARATLGPDKLLVVYVPMTDAQAPAQIAGTIREHQVAGADHVIVGSSYGTDFAVALGRLEPLGAELGLV